jgi:hypothetical protein
MEVMINFKSVCSASEESPPVRCKSEVESSAWFGRCYDEGKTFHLAGNRTLQ